MAATFTEWVRSRSDDELVTLLRARPDLGTPAPSTLRSFAARAGSRTSLERAVAHLDAGRLQILEALLALSDGATPVGPNLLATAIGAPEASTAVEHVLDRLREAALVWDDGDGVRPAPGLDEVLGPYPAGLGPVPDRVGDSDDAAAAESPAAPDPAHLDALDPAARQVLDALAWGPPVGVVPQAGTGPRRAVDTLVADGLLQRSGARHVLLPRPVGLALRGGRTHRSPDLEPPRPEARTVPPETVDAEAAGAALDLVRRVARLVSAWDDTPPVMLRAGGLGVRDLRRTATLLECDEPTAAVVLEITASAGLVADDGESPATYAPTVAADSWERSDDAERWATLARAWATSRRTAWQVGSRDEKGAVRAPLAPDLNRPWVPRLRAQVLGALTAQPGAALGLDDVLSVLRWHSPRSVPPDAAVAGLLAEAALLGVTGAGALSSPGRVLAQGLDEDAAATDSGATADRPPADLAAALQQVLPAEVPEILLQGDLTGIVPGRPSRDLARLIDQAADVESRGAATTVRFTAASITRALDHGRGGDELLAELASRSPVPVPQPLQYLVKDTARRHEALRVGAAQSYVRAADPAVLAGLVEDPALASWGLVRLAPTVLAAAVPAAELHQLLRERGHLSALEGPDGRAVARVRRPQRLDRGRWARRSSAVRTTTDSSRAELVARMRAGSGSPGFSGAAGSPAPSGSGNTGSGNTGSGNTGSGSTGSGSTGHDGGTPAEASAAGPQGTGTTGAAVVAGPRPEPGDSLAELAEALRDGRSVWIELVGGSGTLERRELKPLKLDGGRLRALDTDREAELTIAVHRIASVEPVD